MAFLTAYRVLDLSDERGLIAGRMLADLGADVVQLEPVAGSTARQRAPMLNDDISLFFDAYAANKRGVAVDLVTEEGRQLVHRLADAADILIESARPGTMAALCLGYDQLKQTNPRLIYVSITAFGQSGPKALYQDADLIAWAAGGPLDPHRDEDRPPVRISLPQAFLQAGADAAAGALLAVHARHRTGRGQHVDVSAQASLGIATLGRVLADAVGDEQPDWEQPVRKRVDQSGSGSGTAPSQKKWPCRDGIIEFHIGVGAAAGGFTTTFMRWMVEEGAAPASVLDIDWRTVPQQMEEGTFSDDDMEQIRGYVAAFLAQRTKTEVLQAAMQRKLLCVPIYDTGDVATSDQLRARDFWVNVGEGAHRRRLPGAFAKVSVDGAFSITRPAPSPGQHTDEVIAEWAGTANTVDNHPSGARHSSLQEIRS